jgi:DHA3 family macrolide efflux protein-like MFS transporter
MNGNREQKYHFTLNLLTMFWVAQAITLFGDRLNNFSLLALINRFAENPSLMISINFLAMFLPFFTLAPFTGALIDRLDKRWVLVLTDIVRGLLVILIPLTFARTGQLLPVMFIVFLVSVGNLFFLPAKSSLIPELVPPEKLIKTNSLLWIAGIVGVIGGFLGGGLIFDYLKWETCFYLDGATYIISAFLLLSIALAKSTNAERFHSHPEDPISTRCEISIKQAITSALGEIKDSPMIALPLGVQSLIFFGGGGFLVLAVVLIKEASPPGSSIGLSIAGISAGFGMGMGSVLINHINSRILDKIDSLFFLLFAPAAALIASGSSYITIAAGTMLAGSASSPLFILAESQLQERSNRHTRAILFSFREISTRSLFLTASFLFTYLSKFVDKSPLLYILGLVLALTGLIWIPLMKQRYDKSKTQRR